VLTGHQSVSRNESSVGLVVRIAHPRVNVKSVVRARDQICHSHRCSQLLCSKQGGRRGRSLAVGRFKILDAVPCGIRVRRPGERDAGRGHSADTQAFRDRDIGGKSCARSLALENSLVPTIHRHGVGSQGNKLHETEMRM